MSQIRCNLATVRKKRNLKQTDLSRMAGLSQKALSELETGKSKGVSFNTLAKLCDVLGIGIDQMFELTPDENHTEVSISRVAKPSCSFCNKNEKEVDVMVVAKFPDKTPVYICSGCIVRCNQLLEKTISS